MPLPANGTFLHAFVSNNILRHHVLICKEKLFYLTKNNIKQPTKVAATSQCFSPSLQTATDTFSAHRSVVLNLFLSHAPFNCYSQI